MIIDGIADLCSSPNDEAESLELISNLHALAQEYRAAITCVLHEHPLSRGFLLPTAARPFASVWFQEFYSKHEFLLVIKKCIFE